MYQTLFRHTLQNIRHEGRYRIFRLIERQADCFPHAFYHHPHGKRIITMWCSNDYLGLSVSHEAREILMQTAQRLGVGAGGTRNISGTTPIHAQLEQNLAALHGKEAALLFTSGYIANEGTLSILGSLLPNVLILSDSENHASLIAGIRHSRAEKKIFRHNDASHLTSLLKMERYDRPKIIVAESVYSMSGDMAPLQAFVDLAGKYNALLYLDEVHAVGLYGEEGGGIAQALGLAEHVDILQGTLGKAIGTIGGYVAATHDLIDLLRSTTSGFIFTTALPTALVAASCANVQRVRQDPSLRAEHQKIVEFTKDSLKKAGLPLISTPSHILPLWVGDAHLCQEMGTVLLEEYGLYLQPINYPTVPRGEERFRITPSRLHTPEMAEKLTEGLQHVWQQLKGSRIAARKLATSVPLQEETVFERAAS